MSLAKLSKEQLYILELQGIDETVEGILGHPKPEREMSFDPASQKQLAEQGLLNLATGQLTEAGWQEFRERFPPPVAVG